LLKLDIDRAYLLALPHPYRKRANPDDPGEMEKVYDRSGEGGEEPLTTFRNCELVMALMAAGLGKGDVVPLAVRSWSYKGKTYTVERTYRVSMPEGQMDFLIPAIAEQDVATGGRKWHVDVKKVAKVAVHPTPLGEGLMKVRQSAQFYLKGWTQALEFGKIAASGGKEGPVLQDKTSWERLRILAKDKSASEAEQRAQVRKRVTDLFAAKAKDQMGKIRIPDAPLCQWKQTTDGRLQLTYPIRIAVALQTGLPFADHAADGILVVETQEPVDPRALTAAPAWQVVEYKVQRVVPMPVMKGK
jgi:hypothetical protein